MLKNASIRLISLAAAAALLASSLLSCSKKYDFPESTESESRAVFTVGDRDVPFDLYRYFFMNFKKESDLGRDSYWKDADLDAEFNKIDQMARESIIRLYATLDLAAANGIDYSGKKFQKTITDKINAQIKDQFGDVDTYVESLGQSYLTHSAHVFILTEFECEEQLYDLFLENGTIKNSDDALSDALSNGEFCRAKQVLIKNDPGDDIEKNRKLAEDILMQAQLGDDFDALVAKYGEDPEMITSPVGYYFTHNQLIEEFEEAAFALEVGGFSGVVESSVGFHVIQRCELDPAYVSANRDSLLNAYVSSQFYGEVSKYAEKLTLSETDFFGTLSFADFYYPTEG